MNTIRLLQDLKSMTLQAQGGVRTNAVNDDAFSHIFQDAIQNVSSQQINADDLKTRYELGDNSVNISQVMIEGQKATIGFESAVRVRNKLVQAYEDIMNMPV